MKLKRILIVLLSLFCLIYLVGLAYINSHEVIHAQIYNRYGISSYSQIDYIFLSGFTKPDGAEIYKCNDVCKLQHSLNDIIGYNIRIIIFNLWALFIVFFIYRRLYESKD